MVWRTASQTLERMGEPGAMILAGCLEDDDHEVWRRGEQALQRMRPVTAPNLGKAATLVMDKDPNIRLQALAELQSMGATAAPALVRLAKKLEQGDAWQQRRISDALINTGDVGIAALAHRLG